MNIKFKHACFSKLALLAALLFVAAWFAFVSDLAFGQSAHEEAYQTTSERTYNNSIFILPTPDCLFWDRYFTSQDRARHLIVP